MKFIKEHKFTTLVIVIFIAVVILLYFAVDLFFTNSGKPEYGNRLDGIEEVKLEKKDISSIESKIKENKKVKKVETNIAGRTVEVVITVLDDVSIKDAKSIGSTTLSAMNEKQISYYSVQVFVKKESKDENNFPIIGYKQRGTKELVWTKDRAVTKDNEDK